MWTLRRRAARVVLLDGEDRVLLIRASDPIDPTKGSWWEIPGGGVESGESSDQAAARELHEETGITATDMSGAVWLQHVTFDFAGYHFDQHERVHIARCAGGEYCPAGLEALEDDAFEGAEWWPLSDLAGLAAGGDRIIPPWLPEQLPAVLAAGLPADPIDLGEC